MSSAASSPTYPKGLFAQVRPQAVSASPAYLMSGALATTSVVSFLRHPSLRSTFYLLAGSLAAGTYYLDAQAVNTRLEDGPWGGVAASALVGAATLPRALQAKPAAVVLALGALGTGGYYLWEGLRDEY